LLFKTFRSEKGVILVAAMGISLIMMVATMAIMLNSGFFIETSGVTREMDQMTFTADFGLENYRYYLWDAWCAPPTWCRSLGPNNETQTIPTDQYIAVTRNLTKYGAGQTNLFKQQDVTIDSNYTLLHQILTNNTTNITKGHVQFIKGGNQNSNYGRYDYRIFAKRGPNPKILYTMSSATKRKQAGDIDSISEERYEKRTTIEAALHFSIPCVEDYKQFGQCKEKQGESAEGNITGTVRGVF